MQSIEIEVPHRVCELQAELEHLRRLERAGLQPGVERTVLSHARPHATTLPRATTQRVKKEKTVVKKEKARRRREDLPQVNLDDVNLN